ncbi:hypothetical protein [Microbacterium oxydans]|uniref:hypothetical protein n=1 Tax=Microbacterium oxydans TaxID=82380 RepID=UPI001E3C3D48|nr:hypothetical protein [Microbacterium oxydans]
MDSGRLLRRATIAALVIATLAVSASGCAVAESPGYAGEPTAAGQPLTVDRTDGSDIRAWSAGDLLIVTTTGSGSCPSVPVIDEIDDGHQLVSLTTSVPYSQGACTSDSVPRTFELDAGRDLSGYTVQVAAD